MDLPKWMVLACVGVISFAVFLVLAAEIKAGETAVPVTSTSTTLENMVVKYMSWVAKPFKMSDSTFCYALPPMPIPYCVNGTKQYRVKSDSSACSTFNGSVVLDSAPAVLLFYNNTAIWGPPFKVPVIGVDGLVNRTLTPKFEISDMECDT